MSSPKRNVAYEFYISLVDSADTGSFKVNPTITVGDFKVSTDGGAFTNLATLPVVDPAGSIGVKINLSQGEMNGDKIMVQCIDVAGAEWDDVLIFIDATVANVDDVVRSTTPENALDVNADGEAGLDYNNTSGTIDASDFGANCITATKIADNAFVAANFAASSLNGKGDWNTVIPDVAGTAPTLSEIIAGVFNAGAGTYEDTAAVDSLTGVILQQKHSTLKELPGKLIIKKTDDTTTFDTLTLETDPGAYLINKVTRP